MSIPPAEYLESTVSQMMGSMTRADMENMLVQALAQQMSMNEAEIREYTASMSDEDLEKIFRQVLEEQVKAQYAAAGSRTAGPDDPGAARWCAGRRRGRLYG